VRAPPGGWLRCPGRRHCARCLRASRVGRGAGQGPPPPLPSVPYKVDTSRPSLGTNWTRLARGARAGPLLSGMTAEGGRGKVPCAIDARYRAPLGKERVYEWLPRRLALLRGRARSAGGPRARIGGRASGRRAAGGNLQDRRKRRTLRPQPPQPALVRRACASKVRRPAGSAPWQTHECWGAPDLGGCGASAVQRTLPSAPRPGDLGSAALCAELRFGVQRGAALRKDGEQVRFRPPDIDSHPLALHAGEDSQSNETLLNAYLCLSMLQEATSCTESFARAQLHIAAWTPLASLCRSCRLSYTRHLRGRERGGIKEHSNGTLDVIIRSVESLARSHHVKSCDGRHLRHPRPSGIGPGKAVSIGFRITFPACRGSPGRSSQRG
jgi:hypothetical protein